MSVSQMASEKTTELKNVRTKDFKISKVLSTYPHKLPNQAKPSLTEALNSLLANEFTLFIKTLNYHWNVTGPRFHSVHKFLDDHYNALLVIVDDIAERIREIGDHPIGTIREIQNMSDLAERPGEQPITSKMISDLMSDHEAIQIQIKTILKRVSKSSNDPGTEDFLTSLLKKHEEMSWMLRSHIES